MNKNIFNAHRLATISLLIASSLIIFVVESFFPPMILPGAKLGLANIFTLIALIIFSPIDAFIILIIRCLLGNLIVGNLSALIYSLPAGLISLMVSTILVSFCINKISLLSISIVSAVLHNITQNLIFCAVTNTKDLFVYTPYLALLGIISGIVVGIISYFVIKYLPKSVYAKALGINKITTNEE